jgi:hypothetical protein
LAMDLVGFRVAARLFPCQKEGFDIGAKRTKGYPLSWPQTHSPIRFFCSRSFHFCRRNSVNKRARDA